MANINPWPEAARKLYAGLVEAMRESSKKHRVASDITFLKFDLQRSKKKRELFSLRVRVQFRYDVGMDEMVQELRAVNTINEKLMARKVFVGIPSDVQANMLGNPLHPVYITFLAQCAELGGGSFETTMMYSDDGGEATRHRTFPSTIAGEHIMDYLMEGKIDGDYFPG